MSEIAAVVRPLRNARVADETLLVRFALIAVATMFLLLILFLPLLAVFAEAFRRGIRRLSDPLTDPDALAADSV